MKLYLNLNQQRALYEWCRANAPALLNCFVDRGSADAWDVVHSATFSDRQGKWLIKHGAPIPAAT